MVQVQITLTSTMGYKPISTIIDCESITDFNKNQKEYIKKAKIRMCIQRHWDGENLRKWGYTELKARKYDKEKIEREKKERYEQIKKERGWA